MAGGKERVSSSVFRISLCEKTAGEARDVMVSVIEKLLRVSSQPVDLNHVLPVLGPLCLIDDHT